MTLLDGIIQQVILTGSRNILVIPIMECLKQMMELTQTLLKRMTLIIGIK